MSFKVVMISSGFHPYVVGGAERQALELSAALRRRGHDVVVLTRLLPGLAAEDTVRGVPVRRIGGPGALSFMLAVYRRLRATPHDVAHVHLAGSPAVAAALASPRVVVKLGGGKGIGELATGGWLKLRLLAALKPRFVAVARELVEEARRYLGVEAALVPNGVDVERFKPAPRPQRPLAFLYAGRLSWEKQLPRFARVWARAAAGTGATLTLIGEGPEKIDVPGVRILPPVEDMVPHYQAADVFVLPSVSEGLSNALLEAMACGLAPLASRVGGTAEAVEDGISGLLFGPDDEAAMEAAIRRLLGEPGLAARLGQAARSRAERYSLEETAKRYEALYAEVASTTTGSCSSGVNA